MSTTWLNKQVIDEDQITLVCLVGKLFGINFQRENENRLLFPPILPHFVFK
jgi:hypothetical protein